MDSTPLRAAAHAAAAHLAEVPWLDVVPPRWRHLTICDVGFADELTPHQVDEVSREVAARTADGRCWGHASGEPRVIDLGPVEAVATAIVLQAEPVEPLRVLHATVRDVTQRVLGPGHPLVHTRVLQPHVTLAYVNRDAARQVVDDVLASVPLVSTTVPVERLTLARVTRRDHHYQWVELEHVDLIQRQGSAIPLR